MALLTHFGKTSSCVSKTHSDNMTSSRMDIVLC